MLSTVSDHLSSLADREQHRTGSHGAARSGSVMTLPSGTIAVTNTIRFPLPARRNHKDHERLSMSLTAHDTRAARSESHPLPSGTVQLTRASACDLRPDLRLDRRSFRARTAPRDLVRATAPGRWLPPAPADPPAGGVLCYLPMHCPQRSTRARLSVAGAEDLSGLTPLCSSRVPLPGRGGLALQLGALRPMRA
jgi:hypothetical protein